MNKSLISVLVFIAFLLGVFLFPPETESQKPMSVVGTWAGYDQTDWQVMLIFRADMTLRVMLREFTWDTPYIIDYSKKPVSIDIDDFESEEITGVNQRDYRLPEAPFLGIVSFSEDGNKMTFEGYNGKGRPERFSRNSITLTRKTGQD